MRFAFYPDRKLSRTTRSGRLILVSALIHIALGAILLCLANAQPAGTGNGLNSSGSLSLTWIPGRDGDGKQSFDTTVAGAGAEELSVEQPEVPPQQMVKQASLIKTTELEDIFQDAAASSFKEEIESRTIRAVSYTEERPTTTTSPKRQNTVEAETESVREQLNPAPRRQGGTGDKSGHQNPGQKGGGGPGAKAGSEVGFFGIFTRTRRVVYVIDASDSMRKHDAIGLARRELSESLRTLEPKAYFQIVFFDVTPHAMNRAKDRRGMLQATSHNLRIAEHFMKGIQPDSGTDRFAALKQAFSFEPDVIFLLTDADEPVMSERELKEIARMNKRQTAIHVVEYSFDGGEQKESFLQQLAAQNHGEHYFCDVKEWAEASEAQK